MALTTTSPFAIAPGIKPEPLDPFWIGNVLVDRQHITADQLRGALDAHRERRGSPFVETLTLLGLASPTLIAQLVSEKYALPLIDLGAVGIDPGVARTIPASRALRVAALPFRKEDRCLHIAVADPTIYPAISAAADLRIDRTSIRYYIAAKPDILSLIDEAWNAEQTPSNAKELLIHFAAKAIRKRASDIHLEPKPTGLEIRYRIDGELVHEAYLSNDQRPLILNAVLVAAQLDHHQDNLPQDGQAKLKISHKDYTFRIATLPTNFGLTAVMRILDDEAHARSWADQGVTPSQEAQLRRLLAEPNGVVLATGPTGSGKTTLAHSLLNQIHAPSTKIITIEDPIEYTNPRFTQIPVNTRAGLTFASALRAVLRADPDVIYVAEIRDLETAEIAIRSSLTGHLVFSSLHTNTPLGAVARLVDMKIERFLVTSAVRAVIGQRLVKRLCKCSVTHPRLEQLRKDLQRPEANFRAPNPNGCPDCNRTGFHRRIGIFSIYPLTFDVTPELRLLDNAHNARLSKLEQRKAAVITDEEASRAILAEIELENASYVSEAEKIRGRGSEVIELIHEHASEEKLAEIYRRRGFCTMRDDGLDKAAQGITTVELVLAETT